MEHQGMRILFDSKNEKFKKPFGAIKTGQVCYFNILVPKTCPAEKVFIIFENDGKETRHEMHRFENESEYVSFKTQLFFDNHGLYFYWFYIKKAEGGFNLYKQGYSDTNMEEGEKWQLTCYKADYCAPEWAKGAVIYQIFPDRFNKKGECDLSEKLTPFRVHENLNDAPDNQPDDEGNWNNDFFGGNLAGIIEKLDYLKELGVDVIYLNPIVKAFSNHRYDTADYLSVDPMLGSLNDFKNLCDEAHKRNIRIIFDGVYNHTGKRSIYFESALNDINSPYKEWYDFKKFPYEYFSWWGINTLPQIKKGHPDFIKFIAEKVIPFWLKLGADGVRLDVADELTDGFIQKISEEAKKVKKDALIMGEVWEDASNKISYSQRRKYLLGSELDSVMNYPFLNAIIGYVKNENSAEKFSNEIMTIVENYPSEILHLCMNSLSTHDTARILTVLEKNKAALKTAAFLQFMLPGSPSIYYGDEIGMEGRKDPFNRAYFNWNDIDENLQSFFKKIAQLKHQYPELKDGNITFEKNETALVFYREKLKIVINVSNVPYEVNGDILFSENTSQNKIYKHGFALIRIRPISAIKDCNGTQVSCLLSQ